MLKGYKTVIFNIIMTVIMVISLWNPSEAQNLPDAGTVSGHIDTLDMLLSAVWGIGNVVLRAVTTTPIFKKETP